METTPRRSKRFQPLLLLADAESREYTVSLLGSPISIRKTRAVDVPDEDDLDEDEEFETVFYNGFSRAVPIRSPRKRREKLEEGLGESFSVGDTVLVKTQAKTPSVGVIVAIWEIRTKGNSENSTSVKVKVQWFLRPSELPNIRAKRDHLQTEIYFSISSTAILPPHYIIQQCNVSSKLPIEETLRSPSKGSIVSVQHLNDFYCSSAIDARRGLYYNFLWERHSAEALSATDDVEGTSWEVLIKQPAKKGRRKRIADEESSDSDEDDSKGDDYVNEDNDGEESGTEVGDDSDRAETPDTGAGSDDLEDHLAKTPTKKRKSDRYTVTPRKRKRTTKTVAAPTPHSKAALRIRKAKRMSIRPPPPEQAYEFLNIAEYKLPKDPWLRAMQVLHVGARPDVLPCREEEFSRVLRSVEGLLEEGSGGCVYISGVPGTGKTATVHRIVRELKRMAERDEANPFTYVEINGLKIPEPAAAYSILWEAVSGHDIAKEGHMKISSKEALKQLTKFFGAGVRAGPGGHACVVLMDELDQLMTTKQDVVYNFFNWPTLVGSKLVVIAVANTMDLPERAMTGRVRSRLGMVRINFKPYTTPQLEKIVHSRLQTAKEGFHGVFPDVIMPDGIKFAAMKVSSISGDARRVLDICRRAVELVQPHKKAARTDDVRNVIVQMQNSPTAAFLKDCSLHERIMLAALLKCVKRDGVEEIKWDDIQYQHLIYMNILTSEEDSQRKPNTMELRLILDSLVASHALLVEDSGAAIARKADGERKVILNIEQNEVERVLSDMGGQRWKNALGI